MAMSAEETEQGEEGEGRERRSGVYNPPKPSYDRERRGGEGARERNG